jgi:hypothetical protein
MKHGYVPTNSTVLRRISGHKRKVRKNSIIRGLLQLLFQIAIWAERVAQIGDMINAYRILVGKCNIKRLLGKTWA